MSALETGYFVSPYPLARRMLPWGFCIVAVGCIAAASQIADRTGQLVMFTAGVVFLLGAGRIFWATSTKLGRVNGSQNDLKQVVLRDRSYAFLTNGDGDIEICSEAASERFDGPNRQNLAQ